MTLGSSIRLAEPHDIPALVELVGGPARRTSRAEIDSLLAHGITIVLPANDGRVLGAAHLEIADRVGQIDLLVIAADADFPETERRLVGVASAMCEAHGCDRVELLRVRPPAPPSPAAPAR